MYLHCARYGILLDGVCPPDLPDDEVLDDRFANGAELTVRRGVEAGAVMIWNDTNGE